MAPPPAERRPAKQWPAQKPPERAPSKAELAERDRYARLATASMETVRASARTWRTGLTAFITLVTTGVVIKGRDTTAGLAGAWRAPVTILVGGGLLLAVIGLWHVLAAEAGTDPRKQTLQTIRKGYGTLDAYQVHLADLAASRLKTGRRAVAAAVVFLLAGIAVTWWAPIAGAPSPAYVRVTHGQTVTCGTLQPSGAGQLRLSVPGSHMPLVIPFSGITAFSATPACS